MEAAAAAGGAMLTARLGDAGLFEAVLESLKIPEPWRRRLRRGVARGLSLEAIFSRPSQSALAQPGVLAALESADHAGAKALVEDLLAIAGIDAVGGRTPGEIADRFLEQASLRSGPPIEAEKRAALDAFLAISGDPDQAAIELRRLAHSAGLNLSAALEAFERRNGFIAARGVAIEATRFSAAFVRDFDYYTGFVFEAHDPHAPGAKTALSGGRYDGLARRLGARSRHSRRRRGDQPRSPDERGRALMAGGNGAEGPFVLAVPSKGRLQEAAHAFFARAGLELIQGRGARDYRGAIAGLPGVEVAYVSSAEIVGQLAAGAAHFGVAGEDLLREKALNVEARFELLSPLGFGHANVVVAAPKTWIDVRTMADLDDVAQAFRAKRGERMRVATKYVNLTRRFFAEHGVADYRIVESLGATEGAPASGAAELIVDITTTGATLAANALKPLDDGTILRSQANLIASLAAPWGAERKASRARHPRPHRGERGGAEVARSPGAAAGSGRFDRRSGPGAIRCGVGDWRGGRSARARRAALRPRQGGRARRLAFDQRRRARQRSRARTDLRRPQRAL